MLDIPYVSFTEVSEQLDAWGISGTPFVFYVNYDQSQAWAGSREDAERLGIQFEIRKRNNLPSNHFLLIRNLFPTIPIFQNSKSYRKVCGMETVFWRILRLRH